MSKKKKTEKTGWQAGDLIKTIRNQEVITAVLTDTDVGLTFVQVTGPEFSVDEKEIKTAE